MGLVLIVILIGIALLFGAQYALKKPATTTQSTKEKTIVINFITAMLNTNTDCGEKNIGDYIKDCAQTKRISCSGITNACQYAKDQIKQLLTPTLGQWRKKYDLTIMPEGGQTTAPTTIFLSSETRAQQKACEKAAEVTSSGKYPFTIVIGYNYEIELNMC